MRVHLVDGTYELFRCFHGAPRAEVAGREVGAVRGLLATLVSLLGQPDVTHVAVSFDSVVDPPASRRDRSADGVIASQQSLAAQTVRALGVPVWPSGRYQADEVLASAAHRLAGHPGVDQVVICSNDNDFAQCVRGDRVVLLDRSRKVVTDEARVRERFGVAPQQIPDLFALVGDVSDGLPGLPGWGLRSAAAVLARYGTVDAIPLDPAAWDVAVRGRERLGAVLRERHGEVLLCRDLSVLRTDLPVPATPEGLAWPGARRDLVDALVRVIDDGSAVERITRWA
jgi:5'-3' exonuclease